MAGRYSAGVTARNWRRAPGIGWWRAAVSSQPTPTTSFRNHQSRIKNHQCPTAPPLRPHHQPKQHHQRHARTGMGKSGGAEPSCYLRSGAAERGVPRAAAQPQRPLPPKACGLERSLDGHTNAPRPTPYVLPPCNNSTHPALSRSGPLAPADRGHSSQSIAVKLLTSRTPTRPLQALALQEGTVVTVL